MSPAKKVLIIDDEKDLCLLLKEYFQNKNYEVTTASTLSDCKAIIDQVHPDILFLDNNLPDGTGWQYAPVIASRFHSIYVVMMSAFHPEIPAMPATARYCVIEKPIGLADLDKLLSGFR